MKKEDIIKKNLRWIVAFILIVLVWIGLAPEWYSWYQESWIQEPLNPDNEKNKMWIQSLYELLNGRWLVNIPICITLGYFTVRWCLRIAKDNDIRLYRPILALLGFVLLFVRSQVDYAKVVCDLDYRMFLTLLLGLLLLTMALKIWKPNLLKDVFIRIEELTDRIINWMSNICKEKQTNEENIDEVAGFPIDSIEKTTISENLKQYASIIVDKLLATNIHEGSFAVGITGGWGVGKTKFLDTLKEQMKVHAEVVEFNPWMCRTPEQVTQDFFSSLRHQLSQKYSTLSKSIKEYSKLVGNLPIAPQSIFSFDMTLPMEKDSLFEKKQNLSMKFSRLNRPVVVFIDDMDRLEKEEVFEVLRLIRNTADLKNTIYIVAYDREYVTYILNEKQIKNASSYLEKIFPVEVHMPKVEDKLIWEALKADFSTQDNKYGGRFAKALFAKFNNEQRELILRVLYNYRHVKRFARLYMLNFSHLNKLFPKEIDLIDLFWIELLQMYDQKTYDKLASDPYCLLYYDSNNERYFIKNGVSDEKIGTSENKYDGEKFWKFETPSILILLFGYSARSEHKNICKPENYDKYFTMSISPFKLSITEMNNLLSDNANPEEVVNKWLKGKKYLNSITYQMEHVNVNILQNVQLQNFLQGVLYFGEKIASNNTRFLSIRVISLFQKKRYKNDFEKIAHDTVLNWIKRRTSEEKTPLSLSFFLNKLYRYKYYDMDGDPFEPTQLLISNEEVEEVLVRIMKTYLEKHPELRALDILNEKGELGKLFKNCCVLVEDAESMGDRNKHLQVAFNIVIEHFALKEEKPTIEEFGKALDSMFQSETKELDPYSWDDDDYDYYQREKYSEEMMNAYFGNDDSKFEEFKVKCFTVKKRKTKRQEKKL